ncbi:MAG TPA: choice-of-anchor D domain-containing protein [Vicinamibacterales bacterium]|nr:choice-of-anchor D domain-containing protein [Vicinamibacterales bacterium]
MTRVKVILFAGLACLLASAASAQLSVVVRDISPDQSNNSDPDGASGGRVNNVTIDRSNPARVYAASEFGGIFRSTDGGLTWSHLNGHVPTVTWDVKVDPTNSNKVYATSFYDGRANSRSGINVSTDGGNTWTHPATATPPVSFCQSDVRRNEPAAFGIAIDPANPSHVFVGTNCGLAISTDAGVTWRFADPTPTDRADNIGDVVVHHGGIIDVCGDDGHLRSTDGGTTWTTATSQPLQSGRCSIAASPDESYVLFAVVGTSIFETDDGGQTWPISYANPAPQGRIPFVETNKRSGRNFDLWFGDVGVFRGTCTTPSPAVPGGTQRCTASTAWGGSFTRSNGAHDDSGSMAFVPGATSNACPAFFSSDGGVFRNTLTSSPACHTPAWTQPNVTPHALWEYSFEGVSRPGATPEDLYLGNQDNGSFGTGSGGGATVTWNNERCCDGFDTAGDATRALTTVCCFGGRATRLFISGAGLTGASPEIGTYPPGNMRSFEELEALLTFSANAYAVTSTSGVFVTSNITASPIVWTQLGASSSPANACGLALSTTGGTPTFFVKSGGCDGDRAGTLWRYQGTSTTGTWQQVPTPAGASGFGIYAVDAHDPQRLIASQLGGAPGPHMVLTRNGGATWNVLSALDTLMTAGGVFLYQNQTGPTAFTSFSGYPQPTLVAFDPSDPDLVVAGGADSGVFISANGGTRWQLVTDPIAPGTSGIPHIPRPYFAHFDHDGPAGEIKLSLGTRGRGPWRLTFKKVLMPEIQVPSPPSFDASCAGDQQHGALKVCNTSGGDLVISSITSSNPEFTIVVPSGGFPVTISHDFCFPFEVLFTGTTPGTRTTDLTITSNDPNMPVLHVAASASVGQPTAVTVVADSGNFGEFCPAPNRFKDLAVTINNRGTCPLLVTALSSSSPDFQAPHVLTFPIKIAPGDNIELPVRFQPTTSGAKSASLSITTNDPAGAVKVVALSGTVPPDYVCAPPSFTSIDAAIGPTFGSARTGGYTVNTSGHLLRSFGPNRRFGVQAQAEYMFYPGRQEGEVDTTLLYRHGLWQVGVGGTFKDANVRSEASAGSLSEVAVSVDALLSTIRFGAFASKGLKESDVVGAASVLGAPTPAGQPLIVTEQVLHTVDAAGGTVQLSLVPNLWWLDANAAFLNRHAPGASNTAGAALRVSRQLLPWLVGNVAVDVNESFIRSSAIGTVTVGLSVGRWPRPQDLSNPANPLGSLVPRLHYEVFDRVR